MKFSIQTILVYTFFSVAAGSFALAGGTAETKTAAISGSVGLAGVRMIGLPGNPVTDQSGFYSVRVEYGWSGTVSPMLSGYSFRPASRTYPKVERDQSNQDYIAERAVAVTATPDVPFPSQVRGRVATAYGLAAGGAGGRKVVVVPATEVQPGDFEVTMEDMRVMLHILDERLKEGPGTIRGVFMDYGEFFAQDDRTSEAIYIQDYGMLFLMEVDFPLVFPGESQQKQPDETQEDADPIWQRAQEQVFSPEEGARGMMGGVRPEAVQQRAEQLKRELIRTLKHASNIRNIGPDEWIILSVTGWGQRSGQAAPSGSSRVPDSRARSSRGGGGYGGMGGMMGGGTGGMMGGGMAMGGSGGGFAMGGYGGGGGFGGAAYGGRGGGFAMGASSPGVLTIRAKKSDVDAFAKDQIDFEQFQQCVSILTY